MSRAVRRLRAASVRYLERQERWLLREPRKQVVRVLSVHCLESPDAEQLAEIGQFCKQHLDELIEGRLRPTEIAGVQVLIQSREEAR